MALCERKGITFDLKYSGGCLTNLKNVDTTILFGNLLDNAIESAEKANQKKIVFEMDIKGNYLSILIGNGTSLPVLAVNKEMTTTKPDKNEHGIGVKNIKGVVSKYDGMIQYYEENSMFFCHILLEQDKMSDDD